MLLKQEKKKCKRWAIDMKLIIVIFFLLPTLVSAEIYKTIDENGRVVFTDKSTIEAQAVDVNTNINNADGLSDSAYSKANDIKSNKPTKQKSVVMYSTSWCCVCKNARNYMQSNDIKFKEYDIEVNASANSKYKKLGGKGVPLITVGNNKMSGFSASRLESMLGRNP